MEHLAPGSVDQKRLNASTEGSALGSGAGAAGLSLFKSVEQANYAVAVGKALGLSLPGLGGACRCGAWGAHVDASMCCMHEEEIYGGVGGGGRSNRRGSHRFVT